MQHFDGRFRIMRWFVSTLIAVIMFFTLLTMGVGVYLGYSCYMSNDPNSMACYIMSDRVELGVRYR